MEFSDKISFIRKENNLTQTDFAKKLGVSRGYIAKIEAGKALPSKKFINTFLETFDVTRRFLFSDLEDYKDLNYLKFLTKNKISVNEEKEFENISVDIVRSLKEKIEKLEKFYFLISDIKMMLNVINGFDKFHGHEQFLEKFRRIKFQYAKDLSQAISINENSQNKKVRNVNQLSTKELLKYFQELNDNLEFFELVFFEHFEAYKRIYLKLD